MNIVRTKRPEDRLDYDIYFGEWLPAGDSIARVLRAEVSGADVELEEDGTDHTETSVKVWLNGGAVGKTATVTVEIETVQGRQKEVCFKVRVVRGC